MSKIIRKVISTAAAPKAIGPYSQAVQVNHTLYVSGCIGLLPETAELVAGGVEAETQQSLKNMSQILQAAGSTFRNVCKVTVLLADINDFKRVNDVYAKFFVSPYPARAAYQVAALPKGARVEIEAVAIVGEVEDVPSSCL